MLGDSLVCGRSKFFDHPHENEEPTAKIYVTVRFANFPEDQLAQLDTGAAWTILPPDLAKSMGAPERSGNPVRLISRFGTYEGYLVRLSFTFIADAGESLDTDGTFFISKDWPSKMTFLGYSGLLDSIRFALDPQANHFYFGAS